MSYRAGDRQRLVQGAAGDPGRQVLAVDEFHDEGAASAPTTVPAPPRDSGPVHAPHLGRWRSVRYARPGQIRRPSVPGTIAEGQRA
jgi:hypothetical protein